MDDGEPDSKVSVCVVFVVYCLVQAGNGDSTVTVTEETPTKSDFKVTLIMQVYCVYVSVSRQRSVSVLKQTSVLLSVKLMRVLVRSLIRCVYFCFVCIFMSCLCLLCQDKRSVIDQRKDDSSGDRVSHEKAKVCGVLV